jgi:hypothetical protein
MTAWNDCREYLDHLFVWTAHDLERKLEAFRKYYNQNQVHQKLTGNAPAVVSGISQTQCADLSSYFWISHCNGLFQSQVDA